MLSRLTRLTRQVKQIGDNDSGATRVHLGGRDELSSLATQINGILGKLENSAAMLNESREALRLQNECLEETVMERTQGFLHQALHDSLTGLPNRAHALYRLQQLAENRMAAGTAALFPRPRQLQVHRRYPGA